MDSCWEEMKKGAKSISFVALLDNLERGKLKIVFNERLDQR